MSKHLKPMEQEENYSKCRTFLGLKACHLAQCNYVVSRDVLPHFFNALPHPNAAVGRISRLDILKRACRPSNSHIAAICRAGIPTISKVCQSLTCVIARTRCTNFEDVMHAKLDRVGLIIGHAGSPNGRLSEHECRGKTHSAGHLVKRPINE